ncbi:MAG TPA: polynucleotide adenylyltransferase PcnB, partial [Nitrosomonas sp.]|nr:polynucleotide adenylyltransferase PcnB [Nitrosomonas sp.]
RLALDEKPIPALHQAMIETLSTQRSQIAIPRRFDSMIYDIWTLQPRFLFRSGNRPFRLLEHPRFRAAYDFLWLRSESGEIDKEIAEWWHAFQHANPESREAMLIKETPTKKRKRNTRKRKPIVSAESEKNDQ